MTRQLNISVGDHGVVAMWRGSARTLPLGAFTAAPSELVVVLRRMGAPTQAIADLLAWADEIER